MEQEFLDILCCPETKQKLKLVGDDLVVSINQKIENKELKSRDGEVVEEKLDAGLIREDQKFIYPIRNEIPVMLMDQSIPV